MSIWVRTVLGFALSLAAAGAVQQALMWAHHAPGTTDALVPLAILVAVIGAAFDIPAWRGRTGPGRIATLVLAGLLSVGVFVFAVGVVSRSPGVGGDVIYLVAVMVNVDFLLPAAAAVPIHWLMLRQSVRTS